MSDIDNFAADEQESPFLTAYTKILVAAWTDDEYAARLDSDPVAAIREYGLKVPEGGTLIIARVIPSEHAEPSEESAVTKWEAGEATGTYVLSVPEIPAVDLGTLTDEDLLAIAGGLTISASCCCTPCCSCCA